MSSSPRRKVFKITPLKLFDLSIYLWGICRSCGLCQKVMDPDTRAVPCSRCGSNEVYSSDELRSMGELEVEG
jgi:hypothetical protein